MCATAACEYLPRIPELMEYCGFVLQVCIDAVPSASLWLSRVSPFLGIALSESSSSVSSNMFYAAATTRYPFNAVSLLEVFPEAGALSVSTPLGLWLSRISFVEIDDGRPVKFQPASFRGHKKGGRKYCRKKKGKN